MNPETWTYNDLWNAVQSAITKAIPYGWIVDLKPLKPSVVYGDNGRTFEAPFTVSETGDITMGDAVEVRSQTVYWPIEEAAFAQFASAPGADGMVELSGLLWRAGRFPERPIRETTEQDVAAIVASFDPERTEVIFDHNPNSFLNQALHRDGAKLTRVWQKGTELWGTIRVPGWFASAARDIVKSVSVGLDGSLRRLREISFVSNPRIEDAAVFRALPAFSLFAQAHPDLAPHRPSAIDPQKTMNTSIKDRVLDFFRRVPADQRGDLTEQDLSAAFANVPEPATTQQGDPQLLARIAELEQREATRAAEFAAQQRENAALSFYETQLRGGRVTPAQREAVLDEYRAASLADQHGNFSGEQSFTARLTARYEAMKPGYRFGSQAIDSGKQPEEGASIFSADDLRAAGFSVKEAK
jgi:hypothetical protein